MKKNALQKSQKGRFFKFYISYRVKEKGIRIYFEEANASLNKVSPTLNKDITLLIPFLNFL